MKNAAFLFSGFASIYNIFFFFLYDFAKCDFRRKKRGKKLCVNTKIC